MSQDRVQISKELAAWLKRSKSQAAQIAVERNFSQLNPEPDTATSEPEIFDNPSDPGTDLIQPFESEYGVAVAATDPVVWIRMNEMPGGTPVEEHRKDPVVLNVSPTNPYVLPNPTQSGNSREGYGFFFGSSAFISSAMMSDEPADKLNATDEFSIVFREQHFENLNYEENIFLSWGRTRVGVYIDETNVNDSYYFATFVDNMYVEYTVIWPMWDPAQFHQVAVTYDGADLKFYWQGVERASEALVGEPQWDSTQVDIDGLYLAKPQYPSDGSPFSGNLNEVAIYDRALTGVEIADLYAADAWSLTNNATVELTPW